MKKLYPLVIILITFQLLGCKSKREAFVTIAPPVKPFFQEKVGLALNSPPPMVMPSAKTINEIEISSQYFKIAVSLVLDKSGKAEAIKNLIDDQFATALDQTKRFTVMDKGTMMNLVTNTEKGVVYETGVYKETKSPKYENEPDSVISVDEKTQTSQPIASTKKNVNMFVPKKSIFQLFGNLETNPQAYEEYVNEIKSYTDGVLRIVITGFDDKNKKLDIDYKISSSTTSNYPLYSGSGKIGFSLEKEEATLTLERKDIESIVDDIAKSFPNPELKTYQIIQVNGRKITVNAGKKDNIKTGMLGYVIKMDGARTSYRAWIEVTEVFMDAFNAELKVEDLAKINSNRGKENSVTDDEYAQYVNLLNTIKVGEFVKMK